MLRFPSAPRSSLRSAPTTGEVQVIPFTASERALMQKQSRRFGWIMLGSTVGGLALILGLSLGVALSRRAKRQKIGARQIPFYSFIVLRGNFVVMSARKDQYSTGTALLANSGNPTVHLCAYDATYPMVGIVAYAADTKPELGVEQRYLVSTDNVPYDASGARMERSFGATDNIGYLYVKPSNGGVVFDPVYVLQGVVAGTIVELLSYSTTFNSNGLDYANPRIIGHTLKQSVGK